MAPTHSASGPARSRAAALGPAAHVLVTRGVVVADERDLVDVDGKQVEVPRFRPPADAACHRLRVASRPGPRGLVAYPQELELAVRTRGGSSRHWMGCLRRR